MFCRFWPDFEAKLDDLTKLKKEKNKEESRSDREVLNEVLEISRINSYVVGQIRNTTKNLNFEFSAGDRFQEEIRSMLRSMGKMIGMLGKILEMTDKKELPSPEDLDLNISQIEDPDG